MDTSTQTASGATHQGHVRSRNEDAFWIGTTSWVVADGMGGCPSGHLASGQAVRSIARVLEGSEDIEWAMLEAVLTAHTDIERSAKRWPAHAGMGTTAVAAHRNAAGDVGITHVGDSRAYLLAGGQLRRLTTDDNEAADLVARGEITEQGAREHPGQSWLTKALGLQQEVAPFPTIQVLSRPSGRLLLCTDGLTGEVEEHEIETLLSVGSPQESCEALIAAALADGARDNVTVVVVDL
ncbi:PP2C family protein-serine/threonine phosphatase [Ornithinimicrobium cryptoxanthini]|uniref:Protein phosphatase 2C domain-containing protein n=1 Tax=Ornithinimicrobium cryptoxanthini TaxID=2934161 RepID=A0ABY4YEY7_9MICO|nr:protein phosphatase 2C domain-containing protein [Ornithinimicrobium cryptoxanthini]USQ75331.1 protein phosphatase 2C domain-containing protein [Ornithinimicrobium cryptoxanthini]